MYNLELVTLLEKVLDKSYQLKNGENAFFCPFCNHHKKKLQVNTETQKWHCWICNSGGHKISQLLRKVGAHKVLIKEALQLVGDSVSYEKDKDEVKYNVSLPREYKPLYIKSESPIYKHATNYLNKRRVSLQEILRYSIGYCESGVYSNRVIIPSYDSDGRLNYFIARDIFPNSKMKYKNPPMSKDIVCFELFINYNEPIVLVEGVMDAIAVSRNAIPLLGKFPSKSLVMKLIKKRVKTIYVALDEDARQDAIKLSKFLMDYGITTYLLDMKDKDPSKLGFNTFWDLVNKTKQTTFTDFIRGKLNG